MIRRLSIFLFVMFAGVACAAPTPQTHLGRLLDASSWMPGLRTGAQGFAPGMTRISLMVIVLGILVSLISIQFMQTDPVEPIVRLMMVMAFFMMVVPINNFHYAVWDNLRVKAMDTIEPKFNSASEELTVLANDSKWLLMAAGSPAALSFRNVLKTPVAVLQKNLGKNSQNLSKWLNLAAFPVIVFALIVYSLILLSGFGLVFAAIILPIAIAVCMLSPEAGESWVTKYFTFTWGSILTVAFMPMIFGAAFDLAILQPIKTVNENFATGAEVRDAYSGIQPPARVAEIQAEIAANEKKKGEIQASAEREGWVAELWQKAPWTQAINRGVELYREYDRAVEVWSNNVVQDTAIVTKGVLADVRNWAIRLCLLVLFAGLGGTAIIAASASIQGLLGSVSTAVAKQLAHPFAGVKSAAGGGQPPKLGGGGNGGGGGGGGKKALSDGQGSSPKGAVRPAGPGLSTATTTRSQSAASSGASK